MSMRKVMALLVTLAMLMLSAGATAAQTMPSQAPADPIEGCNYYEDTGHNLCDTFLAYWESNGGLPVFGYPITEEYEEENLDTGETYTVQYFERERFEYHPENAGTEYEVLLGRLGNEVLLLQGRNWHEFEKSDSSEANYIDVTGFAVAPEFIGYWSEQGLDFGEPGFSFRESLALFGYPISQAEMETNADGDTVLTQWFERARFEFHPDNPEGQQVLLGLLGVEVLDTDEPGRPVGAKAYVDLMTADGANVGVATFVETATGVDISVEVSGLEAGEHGIHIHAVGLCEAPDFTSAGGHFNPFGAEHGFDNPNGPHAGDLPNLEIGEDGTGSLQYTNTLITLGEGEGSLFDEDGSALVIHAGMDDHTTDPAGDSGARVACGVIMEGERPEPDFTVITDGLDQPRHISLGADGALYVAVAGSGGDDCVVAGTDPETGEEFEICFGMSGSIVRIADGEAEEIVTGLPSYLMGEDGVGVHAVAVTADGEIYAVMGLGTDPADRDALGEIAEVFGHLIKIEEDGSWTSVADIAAYEAENNPEPAEVNSNPYSLIIDGDNFIVADAGGNTLLQVTPAGEITTLAVFPPTMVLAPPFLELPEGTEIPMDAVPTSVAKGPDGAYYVGQLTGFPFPVDGASVWRVMPGEDPEVFAGGFTNIGEVAFDGEGDLYVLEIVAGGLLNADPSNPASAASAVTKIAADGTQTTLATEGLIFSTGLTIDTDGSIYATNLTVIPGMGQVILLDEMAAGEPGATLTVVAEGLANPRHISVGGDGAIYVAEAGMDGDECVTVGEGEEEFEVCVGLTGAITQIVDGEATQIATGLPSGNGSGPHDVIVTAEGEMYVLFGLGGPPEGRDLFEDEFVQTFGTLAMLEDDGSWTVIADLAAYEGENNPEPTAVDSNPYSMIMDGENFIVADAGGNTLLQVTPEGEITTLAVFQPQMVLAPPFLELPEGTEIPMESVPTSVVVGPDGAYYVGELTGFPFAVDMARVWRVAPGEDPEVYATGFSAIGAIDFDSEGNLYVLEIASGGLFEAESAGPDNPDAAASAVIKVAADGTQEVWLDEGIFFATGMAIDADDTVYISNFGVVPEMAQVVRVDWPAAE